MKKTLLILASALLILSSCDDVNDENIKHEILPMSTGNYWTMASNYLISDYENDTSTTSIGEQIELDTILCYKSSKESGPYNGYFLFNSDSEGNYIDYGGLTDIDTFIQRSVIFKINAQKGDSWKASIATLSYDSGKFHGNNVTITCLATDTLITTPVGTFKCIAYSYSPTDAVSFTTYLSVNVGFIKSVKYYQNRASVETELIDYYCK